MTFFLSFRHIAMSALAALTATVFAQTQGEVVWTTEGAHYIGAYSMSDQAMSVILEGSQYRGHFIQGTDRSGDSAGLFAASNGAQINGQWGRAFLFASSAKVLQCELNSGFPAVTGHCISAEGRHFRLTTATPSGSTP